MRPKKQNQINFKKMTFRNNVKGLSTVANMICDECQIISGLHIIIYQKRIIKCAAFSTVTSLVISHVSNLMTKS